MKIKIRKIERVVSLALVIFLLASALSINVATVHAATKIEVLNTTYDRPNPSKYYTKYYYKNDFGEWVWKWSKAITQGKMHKYQLNRADGTQQLAYCIEPDKAMGTSYNPIPADDEAYWNALTTNQRTGISLALKFGMQHNKYPPYGHASSTSTAGYIATQCLVWEFKDGVRKFPDCTLTTVTNSSGEIRVPKYTYYNVVKQNDTCFQIYQDILAAIKKYYNGASFTHKTSADAKADPVVLKWNPVDKTYSATVTDTNKCGLYRSELADLLGENYTVTSSNGKYTITRNLTTSATKTIAIEDYKSTMLDNRGGEVQKIWTNSLKQPLITGSSHPVNLYLTVTTEDTGYLQIEKKLKSVPSSEKVDLTSFKFNVKDRDGKIVYGGYPDTSGKLKVRLTCSTYTVSEVLTSAQSKKFSPSAPVKVQITPNSTSTAPAIARVTNTWIDIPIPKTSVKIKINKTMEKNNTFGTGNNQEFKDVVFALCTREQIKSPDTGIIPADTVLESLPIGSEGINTFDTKLPAGKYYIKEDDTHSQYLLSTKEYDFIVNPLTDGSVQTVNINGGTAIKNNINYGSIHLKKTDSVSAAPVNGATYGLFNKSTTEFTLENAIMTKKTVNGQLDFLNVPKGTYKIKELESPFGYILNETVIQVTVKGNNATANISTKDDPYEIITSQNFEMPFTGGDGISSYVVDGIVLAIAGVWLLSSKLLRQ